MSDPITRKEQYYAKMAGEDVNIPKPITREEQYLAQIAKNGGSGGGGSGGGSGTFVLTVNPETFALNMTWQEIYDALAAGKVGVLINSFMQTETSASVSIIYYADSFADSYVVGGIFGGGVANAAAYAESPNDYPVLD